MKAAHEAAAPDARDGIISACEVTVHTTAPQRSHAPRTITSPAAERDALIERFVAVRRRTEELAAPLSAEDQMLQSMPSCSPTKWHRAHTTWLFEELVVVPAGTPHVNEQYRRVFHVEDTAPAYDLRVQRGLISRPDMRTITEYRRVVDARVIKRLRSARALDLGKLAPLVELAIAHEELHQELILTDILHAFSQNPLKPTYASTSSPSGVHEPAIPRRFQRFGGGVTKIGAEPEGFAFDNERPRHHAFLEPFELGTTLVTVAEALAFIEDGGYRMPSLWSPDGFEWVRSAEIEAPPYFRVEDGRAIVFGLEGERVADPAEPLLFASWYEADAIARYLGARLPTEAEWEHAAEGVALDGHFLGGVFHPMAPTGLGLAQMFGTGWEWTSSSHGRYPGFVPVPGALREYNGMIAANERVLRGGSLFTPPTFVRPTTRNSWLPETRHQATAIRLARPFDPHARGGP